MLLDEGSGLETIGPKMSSSSLIGGAPPELFPPPSGAFERETEIKKRDVQYLPKIYDRVKDIEAKLLKFLQIKDAWDWISK